MGMSLLAALALAGLPGTSANDQARLTQTVESLFHPYSISPSRRAPAVWERPIWSRETAALIARWRRVAPRDEVDDLSDGDWLCQCQDWDEHAFRLTIVSRRVDAPRHAVVEVRLRLARRESVSARLLLRVENGAWKLDDLIARDYPAGLKAALRRTIAEDRKLR